MQGGLGSGKTCLAKGIARELGVAETLTSPTYAIISEYPIDAGALYHIDAYRLDNDEDFDNIGGRELISGNGIALIEWSDRIQKSLPDNAIFIVMEITGLETRLIKINGVELL
jgi:tRNA threonylcarbamoyladenosine biosynthesis protein TsaE